jgi:lysophospholipase L1-like esterase
MLDRATIIHARNVTTEMVEALERLRGLLKTDGGHLTQAGRAVIQEGLARGLKNKDLAELLSVSPAAISRHTP